MPAAGAWLTGLLALQQLISGVVCQPQTAAAADALNGVDSLAMGSNLQLSAGRRLLQDAPALGTGQRNEATGRISAAFNVEGEPQALNVEAYMQEPQHRDAEELSYIMDELIPAAVHTMRRSVRLRHDASNLTFGGWRDSDDETVPQPQPGTNLMLKIANTDLCAQFPEGAIAAGWPERQDPATGRPILGRFTICNVSRDLRKDLETLVHEFVHILALEASLIPAFPNRPARRRIDGHGWFITVAAARAARTHFGCPDMPGVPIEDDLAGRGIHFDQFALEGELMDTETSLAPGHSAAHALTDITLGILQDSGWYDVKYGSAGFNPYGYKAGCDFALARYDAAVKDPSAQPYLCEASEEGQPMCLHDASGDGQCSTWSTWDGFYAPFAMSDSMDCQSKPGQRCIQPHGGETTCASLSCSKEGKVQVNGKPCDKSKMRCPDEGIMCSDPGLLTCTGKLNDCSGHGDCVKGYCFCHLGWGGEKCDVPICTGGCDDGSECPESGFCGVPDCGQWTTGGDDTGEPCGPGGLH